MHANSIGRVSMQPVFVADCGPVGNDALVLAHAARTAGDLRRNKQSGGADEDETREHVHDFADSERLGRWPKREIAPRKSCETAAVGFSTTPFLGTSMPSSSQC